MATAPNNVTPLKPPKNLAIWDALSKTDPNHTKGFKRAGGFSGTAIRPIWIIQRLTEQFGPVGVGWGMGKPTFDLVHASEGEVAVYCTVECWHTHRENVFVGVGGDKAVGKNKHGLNVDDEAFKKAFTDAVGNAFKFVGIAADVHMGLFDDSKYVNDTAREFAAAKAGQGQSEESEVGPDQHSDDRAPRGRGAAGSTKSQLDRAEKEIVHELGGCGDDDMLIAYLETAEYKAAKALLEEHRPSALYGPAPEGLEGEFLPIKARIANMVREFRAPGRDAMPLDAG